MEEQPPATQLLFDILAQDNGWHGKLKHLLETLDNPNSDIHSATAKCSEVQANVFSMLALCHAIDTSTTTATDDQDADDCPPAKQRERVRDATVHILRRFANKARAEGDKDPGWDVFRRLSLELAQTCTDIMSVSHVNGPVYVLLDGRPQLCFETCENIPKKNWFKLEDDTHFPLIATTILEILLRTFHPICLFQSLFTDAFYRVVIVSQRYYDHMLSSCRTRESWRARSMTRLSASLSYTLQSHPGFAQVAERVRVNILLTRIQNGPDDVWEEYNTALQESLAIPLPATPSISNVTAVATAISSRVWGENRDDLAVLCRSYLLSCIPTLTEESLIELQWILSNHSGMQGDTDLDSAITSRLQSLEAAADTDAMDVDATTVQLWRTDIKKVIQTIIVPDELTWMDDDESLSDAQYASRALAEIEARFERPVHDCSSQARLALAQKLLRLPCALARHLGQPCSTSPSKVAINAVQPCLDVGTRLLEGLDTEVAPPVRKAVYDALTRSINHQASAYGGGWLDNAAQFAARGLKDKDRTVRLSAGRCLIELVKLYQRLGGNVAAQVDPVVAILVNALTNLIDRCKETAIITVASIAKIAVPEVLYNPLIALVGMLGNANPILKGTAYMQLCSIAEHHGKTAYNLFAPYRTAFMVFLASKICKQHAIFAETCRFLTYSPSSFLHMGLQDTLPYLFNIRDRQTLETIAHHLQDKISGLYFKHGHKILARAFMASKPGHTTMVVNFILSVLSEDAHGAPISARSIVLECLVALLAELVGNMGDEDPLAVTEATHAIMKVERILSSTDGSQRPGSPKPVSDFLRQHMLGILTHFSTTLAIKNPPDVKKRFIRAYGPFMAEVGPSASIAAPQVITILQQTIMVPEFIEVTLSTWDMFMKTLDMQDLGPYIGPTSAAIVTRWSDFSDSAKHTAKTCLEYLVFQVGGKFPKLLDDMASMSHIPELVALSDRLAKVRKSWSPTRKLRKLLARLTNENQITTAKALDELRSFLTHEEHFVRDLTSGDVFEPIVSQTLAVLLKTVSGEGGASEDVRALTFECIGILGALDPDRLELESNDPRIVVTYNFTNEAETLNFVTHLIKDILVQPYLTTTDSTYQYQLGHAIQELLRFSGFTAALLNPGSSVPLRIRNRWNTLPKYVVDVITPLLDSKYAWSPKPVVEPPHPLYPNWTTYREWISEWVLSLIRQVRGVEAQKIFAVFTEVARNRDVGVAHHLLPHLVLSILIGGDQEDADNIRLELESVLKDQADPASKSTVDKRDLSAQTVFMLMEHMNNWVRTVRQELNSKRSDGRRARGFHPAEMEEQLVRVDSIMSSIDQNLMAKAALRSKAYARALMFFEQQALVYTGSDHADSLTDIYDRMHEIYAGLDEPDGMEGITTLILSPSLEHQIRQHESTGKWTSAQSCWEVRLQSAPDDLNSHLGLLRCLRSLGHFDTLRTHVAGVLTRKKEWEPELIGYQVESACMIGNWTEVENLLSTTEADAPPVLVAKVLLAMRSGQEEGISAALRDARQKLGAPIAAAGAHGYKKSYEAILDLHRVYDLETMYRSGWESRAQLNELDKRLSARLERTLPNFRVREPILSIRRTGLRLQSPTDTAVDAAVGQAWLLSAKLARKAGYWQTAYSAVLQARRHDAPFTFMESSRLVRLSGELLRALQELEVSLGLSDRATHVASDDDDSSKRLRAKALLLRAKWMRESDRFDQQEVLKVFQNAQEYRKQWESGLFHLGQFQDECFRKLSNADRYTRGEVMNLNTIKCFGEAISHGDKYIYESLPRLLTLWLDMGENRKDVPDHKPMKRATGFVAKIITTLPTYKWYTAFNQIVSRVDHPSPTVWLVLQQLIIVVIKTYPQQALWLFASAIHTKNRTRRERGLMILEKVKNAGDAETKKLVDACVTVTTVLLQLCNISILAKRFHALSLSKEVPALGKIVPSILSIPTQESLTASLPPMTASQSTHQPFPVDIPTFKSFHEEIDIMRSLAKPRKLTILGSDGQTYILLCKPKDDLRKDARLMDFNAIINKLLKSNSESRRRKLRIRTYGVVTLNEECGLIEWVPNTVPFRAVLDKHYGARGLTPLDKSDPNMAAAEKIKRVTDIQARQIFLNDILPVTPPVFHEWFLDIFPEPSAWLASRLAYSRSAAVMSMVGFILGLGDRHCENILLDTNNGDVVHVDFNCLFEKGKALEQPERVPCRLTQNIVDGFGITGVEGVFRVACEVTMQLLREHKNCLMTVLDAFIHDPLVEWEDDREKMQRKQRKNEAPASLDLKQLAKNALQPIEKKLKGIYTVGKEKDERELSTASLVRMIIEEATDKTNLAKMYVGWAPWY